MYNLTGFQRDVLYCVAACEAPTGIDVKQEIERYAESEINHGHLYPNLNELANEDLISKTAKNGRANVYQITEQGLDFIRDRRQWENSQLVDRDLESDTEGTTE